MTLISLFFTYLQVTNTCLERVLGKSSLFIKKLARPTIAGRLEQSVIKTVFEFLKI